MNRRRSIVVLILAGLLPACSTVPVVGGVPASELGSQELFQAAQERAAAGEHAAAADLAEYLLKTDFAFEPLDELRFLAAEERFLAGDYEKAFNHYRRFADENLFSERGRAIEQRVWTLGKSLIDAEDQFFGDFEADHEVGVEALNYLVTHFPKSERADDAWKELAEAFAADGQLAAAADVYERLMREHPESEWADLASYKVADAYRRQSRSGPFDADPKLRAWSALQRYLARFPDGNFVAAAEAERAELESEIAERELAVADFYRSRGSEAGERLHLANAAARFPEAAPAARATERLEAAGASADMNSADLLKPRTDRPAWSRAPVSATLPGRADGARRPDSKVDGVDGEP